MKKSGEKNIIIVGSGKLGTYIANDYSLNNNIVLIDKDDNILKIANMRLGGKTIAGDAANLDTLLRAGIKTADVVVAATNNDNINIFVSLIAKEKFKIKSVISRLYDEERAVVYKKLGIITVCPSVLSAEAIKKQLLFDNKQEQDEQNEPQNVRNQPQSQSQNGQKQPQNGLKNGQNQPQIGQKQPKNGQDQPQNGRNQPQNGQQNGQNQPQNGQKQAAKKRKAQGE